MAQIITLKCYDACPQHRVSNQQKHSIQAIGLLQYEYSNDREYKEYKIGTNIKAFIPLLTWPHL